MVTNRQVENDNSITTPEIAVLVPCFNEEVTIAEVVKSFREVLPASTIYVYDNNSSDRTTEMAQEAEAIVRVEPQQGKGNVVRRMFSDVDADIYVMVDGDGTYDASAATRLINKLLDENLDMVVGSRAPDDHAATSRLGHRLGNEIITRSVATIFGHGFTDMLSGYRVFSRRFVKSIPALARGFEIETEITVHALQLGVPVAEVETSYFARPEGSASKLNTYKDGFRILGSIIYMFKEVRPLLFFGLIFLALAAVSVSLAVPLFQTFLETGFVPRFPTAILSTGIMLLAFISLTIGLVLDSVCRGRLEAKRLHYLSLSGSPESN